MDALFKALDRNAAAAKSLVSCTVGCGEVLVLVHGVEGNGGDR